mmetsp:Transcript_53391/g.140845  ORF Transcript_53391/g.140845 Transcript_53391/m.140845 type:complete len:264 (-) Transcript_53391:11-802(-)
MESLYIDDSSAAGVFALVPERSCSAAAAALAANALARPAELAPIAAPVKAAPHTSPTSITVLLPAFTSRPCLARVSTTPQQALVPAAAAMNTGVANPPVATVTAMPVTVVATLTQALGMACGSLISCTYSSVQRRLADSVSPPPITSPNDLPHFESSLKSGTSLRRPPPRIAWPNARPMPLPIRFASSRSPCPAEIAAATPEPMTLSSRYSCHTDPALSTLPDTRWPSDLQLVVVSWITGKLPMAAQLQAIAVAMTFGVALQN